MSSDFNPYSSPQAAGQDSPFGSQGKQLRTADLGKRFLGALVDGLAGVIILPGYALMIFGAEQGNGGEMPAMALAGMGWVVVTGLALMVLQIYLLATRSQSLGKVVMKTQIVDVNTGQPAGFVACFLLRALVNGLIGGIPCVGPIYSLTDICFIFREDRRCIHDLIASTVVVDIS